MNRAGDAYTNFPLIYVLIIKNKVLLTASRRSPDIL